MGSDKTPLSALYLGQLDQTPVLVWKKQTSKEKSKKHPAKQRLLFGGFRLLIHPKYGPVRYGFVPTQASCPATMAKLDKYPFTAVLGSVQFTRKFPRQKLEQQSHGRGVSTPWSLRFFVPNFGSDSHFEPHCFMGTGKSMVRRRRRRRRKEAGRRRKKKKKDKKEEEEEDKVRIMKSHPDPKS